MKKKGSVEKMTRRYWNINLKEMIEAGVHFGHGIKKWNPKTGKCPKCGREMEKTDAVLMVD